MYNRFGLRTDDSQIRWYFTMDEARKAAEPLVEKHIPCDIVGGLLVNDEGCTPFIQIGETLETL